LPRNNNLRIHLERIHGYWKFVLHTGDGQSHEGATRYATAAIAADEAMAHSSLINLTQDSAERRQRRLDAIKPPGPIVEVEAKTPNAETRGPVAAR
jgi:hypothetical protein